MQKGYYLPHGDNERDVWLINFVTKVAALPAGHWKVVMYILNMHSIIQMVCIYFLCAAQKLSLRYWPQLLKIPITIPAPT